MAGASCTKTETGGSEGISKIVFDWLSDDATGAVSGITNKGYSGFLVRAAFDPDAAATQPTDQYDVTVTDEDGLDVLNGLGANLSNAANVQKAQSDGLLPVARSQLTLNVTNAGNAKGGLVYLWILNTP